MAEEWGPDILGRPFEQRTLDLGVEGESGPLVATLVRSIPSPLLTFVRPLHDVDVLYVHGWSDYFFHVEVARFWNDLGARFFALDLRRYGRSLRDGETPGYIDSLADYDLEIGMALAAMGHRSPATTAQDAAAGAPVAADPSRRRLVLLGHSTGGLTLSLWAARNPGRASALVLNSPWLELQLGPLGRQAIAPLVAARARLDPLGAHPEVDLGFYTRAQSEIGTLPDGDLPAAWRPPRGFPTHPAWLAAVIEGHRTIAAGIEVGCPALVLLSARSTPPLSWRETMTSTDSVLPVDQIAHAAVRLGRLVTVARIDGAVHDVFLSRPPARGEAFDVTRRWMTASVVPRHPRILP